MKNRNYMLALNKFRITIFVLLCISLSACITLPGHRQTIDEGDFYLHITAPNKAIKSLIRFNTEKTDIAYIPSKAKMELVVADDQGRHDLKIKSSKGTIVYKYRLNGRRKQFGTEQREWFASLVPKIISKTGLKYGPR